MPVKKVKSKDTKKQSKSYTKSQVQSNSNYNSTHSTHSTNNNHQNILDIINKLSSSKYNNNHNNSKSQNNLPARLMRMTSSSQSQPNLNKQNIRHSFSSSAVSSFSSVMKNGKIKTHSEGKEVVNNSNKPFIEIKEMENGNINQYSGTMYVPTPDNVRKDVCEVST